MEKFRGVDYYAIDGLLSEEDRMIRDAVRDWVEAEFLPLITDHHRAGTFPVDLIPKLGELGVLDAEGGGLLFTAQFFCGRGVELLFKLLDALALAVVDAVGLLEVGGGVAAALFEAG